jgi:hypothetical protein
VPQRLEGGAKGLSEMSIPSQQTTSIFQKTVMLKIFVLDATSTYRKAGLVNMNHMTSSTNITVSISLFSVAIHVQNHSFGTPSQAVNLPDFLTWWI